MRGRPGPELTDDDLRRLARLGGDAAQIAEASGLGPLQVRSRLVTEPPVVPLGDEPRRGGSPEEQLDSLDRVALEHDHVVV